jgi:hypothetical protein
MNKIPVFLHIPKNAGTYVLGWTMVLFRYYGIARNWNDGVGWFYNLRRILLQHESKQIATLFVYDPYNVRDSNKNFIQHPTHQYCNIVSYDAFVEELKNKKLTLFSIIVESDGVPYIKDNLYNDICEQNNSYPLYYTIFRDTYNRSESLYSYIKSCKSSHEPTHNAIKSKTFVEYLNSYELEDSWLIRKLTNITDNEIINEEIFNKACIILDEFKIKDIKHTDELIDEVFKECYNIDQSTASDKDRGVFRNSTSSNSTFTFDDLDEKTKSSFLTRTDFDRKLYTKYCPIK